MRDFLENWVNESDENARLVAQELLITEVTEAIWEAIEAEGITKTELANRMGATKGYVSQLLSGSRNMTLRTLSDICRALGRKPTIIVDTMRGVEKWQTVEGASVVSRAGKLRYELTGDTIVSTEDWRSAA